MLNAISAVAEVITIAVLLIVVVVPYWLIVKKAGYSAWLSLLLLVPLVNIIMIWVFACSDWPVLKQNQRV